MRWRGLLELLLPSVCARCAADVPPDACLCRSCDAALPRLPLDSCTLCQSVPVGAAGEPCAPCAARPSPLAACIAAAPFAGDVERWIRRFKYPAPGLAALDPGPGAVLAALIREAAVRAPGGLPELIVPVPLHPRRLRGRGFNPAALLARELARATRIPWMPGALERTRDTPSQTGLDRRARVRNVAGVFRVRSGWGRAVGRSRAGPRVALVDDVVTTGSTLAEAARALRRGGCGPVVGICAARTLGPR